MSDLKWERRRPTWEECETMLIICGGGSSEPHPDTAVGPGESGFEDWDNNGWICVIPPPAIPKMQTIRLRMWVNQAGEEFWAAAESVLNSNWTMTEHTKTKEVPCE